MWVKFAAGSVLGLPLAVLITGVLLWAWPGPWINAVVIGLLLFIPVWVAIMSGSVLFARRRHAWLGLGAANLLAYGLLLLVKQWGQ